MRLAFLLFISKIAALTIYYLPNLNVGLGVGFVLDQTYGTASIAFRDGMICNVAMIPGDEAYREYMRNVTIGPSHNSVPIDYPTYKPTLQTEFGHYTPLERMLRELTRATRIRTSQRYERWHQGASISLPLVFADPDYEERFEFDLLHSLLSLRITSYDQFEWGATALAARGGICLAEQHPLLPATSTANPPLQRFAASAALALSRLDRGDVKRPFGRYKGRFGCSPDPELRRSAELRLSGEWDAWNEREASKQLAIDIG